MLHIEVEGKEFYNEETNEFIQVKSKALTMEHSLLSIAKWESKWKKPYLTEENNKTPEELLDYIRCMTITQNVDPMIYASLSQKNIQQIKDYIDDPHTATVITSFAPPTRKKRIVTSELVYCWMIMYNIPTEYEKWHFNRLMTLIRVCGIENNHNGKKMKRTDVARQNAELNRARRAKYNTKG